MKKNQQHYRGRLVGLLLAIPCVQAVAAEPEQAPPLPQPLTFEAALKLADQAHPQLAQAAALLDAARADKALAESRQSTRVSLDSRLRWVQPAPGSPLDQNDDLQARIYVRRNLYDFGRTDAARDAAGASVKAGEWRLQDRLASRRLAVMEAYFDVILADLEFARDNEAMAVAFVTLDRLRERSELGQVSDIDLLEMEAQYQTVRRQRQASLARQRTARARLALALGRPGELPSDVVRPDLSEYWDREIPDYEPLLESAYQHSPRLKSLQSQLEAARERVRLAQAADRPIIDGELEAAAYSRELGSSDRFRAGVLLQVPLYSGGAVDAAVAQREAERMALAAELEDLRYQLRQSTLENWSQLRTLKVQREEMWAFQDYRQLYLDRSRALYEMELKTDLGDAMVRLTEADLALAQTEFNYVLAWATLEALTDGNIPSAEQQP